ncbi:MAG: hypothetical protein KY441_05490 [Actinobacteria bacterium]|nr:hypothetical protein [Actinomycetota bacterium]
MTKAVRADPPIRDIVGTSPAPSSEPVDKVISDAVAWLRAEQDHGTLIGEETLWREAYSRYLSALRQPLPEAGPTAWPALAFDLVFDARRCPVHHRDAAQEVVQFLRSSPHASLVEQARAAARIADRRQVERPKLRALLAPGLGYPWMFPRDMWTHDLVSRELNAILAPFDWEAGRPPPAEWLAEEVLHRPAPEFLDLLARREPKDTGLARALAAVASLAQAIEAEGKDLSVCEPHVFVDALRHHGVLEGDSMPHWELLALREAVVLLSSYQLYHRAEDCHLQANRARATEPATAHQLLGRAANIYKRICVAQSYPERLLERYQEVCREREQLRVEASLPDPRFEQVLLISTYNSPFDLQRLVLSVTQELMAFGYSRPVHLVVSDDSNDEYLRENEQILDQARRSGLSVSHWPKTRKERFYDQLNDELFPDGSFDVRKLLGPRQPGEKGIPYGRFRNFLRLAALKEANDLGLDAPVSTWLDQDNEIGALVLTSVGTLAKRHVFHYFEDKSTIFADPDVLVGGGGYTNDALEGVEKFWVAWGILGRAFELASQHPGEAPPRLPTDADITRFRPWDQPETLERIPREGEELETLSDQFALLLRTLVGAFRGKYDNQVQIYHPWTFGHVGPEDERLAEETRPFAGMPGGNTSMSRQVLASPIPFITVGGRGEDIFHLWQVEARYGPGSVRLTHTPVLHTRNVSSGRSSLMGEIIDSFNGRIFREPPLIWARLRDALLGAPADRDQGELRAQVATTIENLRSEAMSCIAAVASFAATVEQYLVEGEGSPWLDRAERDPRSRELLETLRGLVRDFKDAERYQRQADEQLLGMEDVERLADEFLAAYPHWETTVAHVAGTSSTASGDVGNLAAAGPGEGYGASLRSTEALGTEAPGTGGAGPIAPLRFVDPAPAPAWAEALSTSLSLFRRYEKGRAQGDLPLRWHERVDRLHDLYAHYASLFMDAPEMAWTVLYRDALFTPHSAPYQAITDLLATDALALAPDERETEVAAAAARFDVDPGILRAAVAPSRGR